MKPALRRWTVAILVTGIFLAPSLAIAGAAAAASGAAFFHGKTVRLIVGHAPGGGYDSYARMIAPHLQEKLGTTVIVENEPGGGGNALTISPVSRAMGFASCFSTARPPRSPRWSTKARLGSTCAKLTSLGRVSYEKRTPVACKGTRSRMSAAFSSRQSQCSSAPAGGSN